MKKKFNFLNRLSSLLFIVIFLHLIGSCNRCRDSFEGKVVATSFSIYKPDVAKTYLYITNVKALKSNCFYVVHSSESYVINDTLRLPEDGVIVKIH